MDSATLLERLRDDNQTALSRLGSSKGLYALTGGEMEARNVRNVAADEAASATQTFRKWADSEPNDDVADFFSSVVDDAQEHYDSFASEDHNPADRLAVYDPLTGFDSAPTRLGGLLGRILVVEKTAEQLVGFFIGEANPRTADDFRSYRSDIDDQRERALAVLDDACEDDDDWAAAQSAATAVIEAAYDGYVETLESMGVKPKNVC